MEYFQEMADQMVLLKMSPYFDLAHVILCAVAVREDIHRGKYKILISKATFNSSYFGYREISVTFALLLVFNRAVLKKKWFQNRILHFLNLKEKNSPREFCLFYFIFVVDAV